MVVQNKGPGSIDGGVELGAWIEVHPVQVNTTCVHAVVTPVHPIWVQHGDELEDIQLA